MTKRMSMLVFSKICRQKISHFKQLCYSYHDIINQQHFKVMLVSNENFVFLC